MPEFSIIVPIYKVEKYLKICVNSILSQSFDDFELILVDDGSPDSCGQICDAYKVNDNRIKVIHKKNGGLSSARNAGIDIAKGKYVIFVDSDDYWDDNTALEHFYSHLRQSQADLLLFSAKRYYEEEDKFTYILGTDVDRLKIVDSDVNRAIKYMIQENIYRAAAWNKVVKKSIIDNYGLRFKEGLLSEDMDWCGDLLIYCNRFDFYNNALYVYRQQRADSITSGKSEKLVADKLYMCDKGYKQALALQDKDKANLLASYYAYEYAVCLGVSANIKNEKILGDMRDLQGILQYDVSNKVKKVNHLKAYLGYNLTRKVLCFFVKIKK